MYKNNFPTFVLFTLTVPLFPYSFLVKKCTFFSQLERTQPPLFSHTFLKMNAFSTLKKRHHIHLHKTKKTKAKSKRRIEATPETHHLFPLQKNNTRINTFFSPTLLFVPHIHIYYFLFIPKHTKTHRLFSQIRTHKNVKR